MRSEIGKGPHIAWRMPKNTRASGLDVQSEDRLLACLGRRASLLGELRQANRLEAHSTSLRAGSVLRVRQGCLTSNDALGVCSSPWKLFPSRRKASPSPAGRKIQANPPKFSARLEHFLHY